MHCAGRPLGQRSRRRGVGGHVGEDDSGAGEIAGAGPLRNAPHADAGECDGAGAGGEPEERPPGSRRVEGACRHHAVGDGGDGRMGRSPGLVEQETQGHGAEASGDERPEPTGDERRLGVAGCRPASQQAEGSEGDDSEPVTASKGDIADERSEHERHDRDSEEQVAFAGRAEALDRFFCSPTRCVVNDQFTDPEHQARDRRRYSFDQLPEPESDRRSGYPRQHPHPRRCTAGRWFGLFGRSLHIFQHAEETL